MRSIAQILILAVFIIGCTPISSSEPTHDSSNITVPPIIISSPTDSIISTNTPYPPLQPDGPYLIFTYDKRNLTIVNKDGSGQRQFQLPNNGYLLTFSINSFHNAISPDGKWIAYFTGALTKEPYDLTLNIYNILDGTSHQISKIIAPGYPESLLTIKTSNTFTPESCIGECLIGIIDLQFIGGLESLSWSPNGKFLAFPAQINEGSSDVFIYSLENNSFRRLIEDNEIVSSIHWSPDGKKILFINSIPDSDYSPRYLYIANPEIEYLKSTLNPIFGGRFWREWGWIASDKFLISEGGEGAPEHNFQYIDITSERMKTIWPYSAESFSINSESSEMYVQTLPASNVEPDGGIFSVSLNGTYEKISDMPYIPLQEQRFSDKFLALEPNHNDNRYYSLYSINKNGEITLINKSINYFFPPVISPDGNWVIITTMNETILFNKELEVVDSWKIPYAEIIWRPDSHGVILFDGINMHFISLINDHKIMRTNCPEDICPLYNYAWIP